MRHCLLCHAPIYHTYSFSELFSFQPLFVPYLCFQCHQQLHYMPKHPRFFKYIASHHLMKTSNTAIHQTCFQKTPLITTWFSLLLKQKNPKSLHLLNQSLYHYFKPMKNVCFIAAPITQKTYNILGYDPIYEILISSHLPTYPWQRLSQVIRRKKYKKYILCSLTPLPKIPKLWCNYHLPQVTFSITE